MTDFNISARDQLNNPGKIFEEITKFTPSGLKTSRSQRNVPPFELTTFNLSEILMRIPAFGAPEDAVGFYESMITGVLGSFWDKEGVGSVFSSLLPPNIRDLLDAASPDEAEFGLVGSPTIGEGSDWGSIRREDIVPSTKPIPTDVEPVTRFGAKIARTILGFDGSIHGMRQGTGTSDHYTGHAIDIMVGYGNPRQKEQGDMIAEFFRHNHAALNVSYVIWYDKITNSSSFEWGYYDSQKAIGRTDVTGRHLDHPHISFRRGPAPVNPRLEWPDGYALKPVGTSSAGPQNTAV